MKSRYFKWMPVLIWMVVIFLLSSQSENTSNENNRFIIYILSHLGLDLDNILGKWSNFMVRKAAHFSEYFILYFLIFRAFMDSVNYKKALMYAFIFTSLYACTDEFHQMFIPGRGPAVRDILIDMGGGAICMLLIQLKKKGSPSG